eukprot:FR737484.1.p1 GENE.FR737484.1~~FR737484.1.p1  ORF type:complete len:206 (+),score=27.89 FR737484.1:214-831(+)
MVLLLTVIYGTIPAESKKLSRTTTELKEAGVLDNIKVSYRKFHTGKIDDNKIQDANYLGTDQLDGESITGIFYSDDYGHGREYFAVSISVNSDNQEQLLMRKITGDENVPAGRISVMTTEEVPKIGKEPVKAKIQIRSDTEDVNGFSFLDCQIGAASYDLISASEGLGSMSWHRAMKSNYDEKASKPIWERPADVDPDNEQEANF